MSISRPKFENVWHLNVHFHTLFSIFWSLPWLLILSFSNLFSFSFYKFMFQWSLKSNEHLAVSWRLYRGRRQCRLHHRRWRQSDTFTIPNMTSLSEEYTKDSCTNLQMSWRVGSTGWQHIKWDASFLPLTNGSLFSLINQGVSKDISTLNRSFSNILVYPTSVSPV